MTFSTRRLSLRQQITALALLAALFATVAVTLLVTYTEKATKRAVSEEVRNVTTERVKRAAEKTYNMCEVAQGFIQRRVNTDLNQARSILKLDGGIKPAGGTTTWPAVNQFTQQVSTTTLPTWSVAGVAFTNDKLTDHRTPVVDDITETSGDKVTIFQRMNDGGDMLRVGTSVMNADGTRAVGTFIPARKPDGSSNPVIETVLSGETYHGRAWVVNAWYITAYEPLKDASGKVIGMLYAGVKQQDMSYVQNAMGFTAKSGNLSTMAVYFGNSSDSQNLQTVVPPTGPGADTEPLWLPKVKEGAPSLVNGKSDGFSVHNAKSDTDTIVQYVYYRPWDWIIVVAADSRDFEVTGTRVGQQFHNLIWQTLACSLVVLIGTGLLAYWRSRYITDPMADLTIHLTSSATQVASSAIHQQANVATFMASTTQIATAVKEISATSQELLRTMVEIADAADKTTSLAKDGRQGLKGMETSMQTLSDATGSISGKLTTIRTKAARINSVVTAITKVADQTNLLSLNAAIEAEKAGEAGAGFAVVAREIRRLADQSAVATLDIEKIVAEMEEAVSGGVEEMRELANAVHGGTLAAETIRGQFGEIIERVESISPRYETVHQGMQNQTEGAQQISDAMWQLTETARQTTESVNDLNDVSNQLHEAVRILKERIFQGANQA